MITGARGDSHKYHWASRGSFIDWLIPAYASNGLDVTRPSADRQSPRHVVTDRVPGEPKDAGAKRGAIIKASSASEYDQSEGLGYAVFAAAQCFRLERAINFVETEPCHRYAGNTAAQPFPAHRRQL